MDKVAPKSSDIFQANRDRAAPLLKQLSADGIGHMVGGKVVASASGEAFGIGRDGGNYSFDFYMETKHVSLARGTHKIQKLGVSSSRE
jgi:hypothetical protein